MSRVEHIGPATLYLGDCAEILPLVGEVDAGVMDPAFAFSTAGGGRFRKARPNMDRIGAAGLDRGFDLDLLSPARFRSVVVFCHNDQLAELLPRLKARYGRYAVLGWRKTNPMPVANKHYRPDTEFFVHAWTPGAHPIGDLASKARWVEGPSGRFSGVDHPTAKPEYVMDKILANVNGQVICDPFMGSGSTGVAAVKAGKRFVGIEIDPTWFDLACRRLEAAVQLAEAA